jgi:7-cyano-7-deazaguanine synthase
MNIKEALSKLPDTNGAIVILSGGMDSTIALRLCVEKYGKENVRALTFHYGQRQSNEIEKAKASTSILSVKHKVFDLSVLGQISEGFSANVDTNIEMPTIKDVLGDPRPKTYVPNRNMILMSVASAFAEVEGFDTVVMGLQIHDEYGYHDTTARFVNKVNDVLSENRIIKIKVIAPFAGMSKYDEIKVLQALDGDVGLLWNTLTCYNPDEQNRSCGQCPSCSERIANFAKAGIIDPIAYSIDIPWSKLINV